MFILDAPYVSPTLVEWLQKSGHPVLDNDFARAMAASGADFNLVGEREAARRIDAGERACTNSENALEWVCANVHDETLVRGIRACKDKEAMRNGLRELDPDLFFRGFGYDELQGVSYDDLPERVVVKPSVGFLSLGVHAVSCQADWDRALQAIRNEMTQWNDMYPTGVIAPSRFLVEQMAAGQEHALDMFYDAEGTPHVANVFRHEFAGPGDTSDRLYWCSGALRDEVAAKLEPWLARAGELLGLRGICVHIELRIDGDDVHAIEFNPLRFAGLGGTDLLQHASGMLAYDAYLEGRGLAPFLTGDRYVMTVITPDEDVPAGAGFDYDALAGHFSHVLDVRRLDFAKMGTFGMMFVQVPGTEEGDREMDYLLHVDLGRFVR